MRISLLGPLTVTVDGAPVDVGGAQARGLLALLALTPGRPVAVDDLVAGVWGDAPPPSAAGTLQSHVSRLRRALEPGRTAGGRSVLARAAGGYVLDVPPEAVDAGRFVALADEGRSRLLAGDAEGARRLLAEALGLWRGEALADLTDLPLAARPRARLEDRRTLALADRIDADLHLGRHAEVVDEAAALVEAHPLDEVVRHRLARALARAGRRDDALAAIADARAALAEASGLDLGPALRRLEDELRRGAGPAPAPPADSGLVGRAGEMALVTAALDESAAGTRVVVVEGEPGIGKTRLVEELAAAAAARGCLVLWGRAFEGGAAPALWPWLGPLRSLLAERRGGELAQLEALVAADSDPAAAPSGAGPARFQLIETVAALVAEAAARRPLVIVLDDLQWADPASLELLTFLSGRLGPAPVLLAVTLRELEVGRNDALVEALAAVGRHPTARRVSLRGLDPAGTRALVARATSRTDLPEAVAAAIHRRAEGNPYFTAELARYLDAEGPLDEAAVAAADVPSGVRDVVRRRLALLPPATAELVEVAAVVGRDVPLDLLADASRRSLDAVLDDLEPALVQRLLGPAPGAAGTVRFSHALVREVVVDDLSPIRRARLHLRVADTLAPAVGDDDAEIVAEHLWAAVPLGVGLRAADALVRASDVAVRRLALTSARSLLARAVQLRRADSDDGGRGELDALGRLVSVMGALAGYAAVADSPELARAEELAHRTENVELTVKLLWAEWAGLDLRCEFDRARPIARELLALSERLDDPVTRTIGHCAWGIDRWHHGAITEAGEHLDRAVAAVAEVADAPHVYDFDELMLPQAFAVFMHDLQGLPGAEDEYDRLTRRDPDRFTTAMAMWFACAGALAAGDGGRAERAARRGLTADPDATFLFWGTSLQAYLGAALVLAGDLDEGLPVLAAGLARYLAVGVRTNSVVFFATRTAGLAAAGRVAEAAEALAATERELATYGERYAEPLVAEARALVARSRGDDPAAVAATLAGGRELAARQGAHAVARRLAATADRLGLGVSSG